MAELNNHRKIEDMKELQFVYSVFDAIKQATQLEKGKSVERNNGSMPNNSRVIIVLDDEDDDA